MDTLKMRALPAVDEVLRRTGIDALTEQFPRPVVVAAIRGALDQRRARIRAGETLSPEDLTPGVEEIRSMVETAVRPSLRRVVNATGVVVHTNLGRSPLPRSALLELASYAGRYANLEYDLDDGRRGSRYDHITDLLAEVTGAEAAHVVNNNAAAMLLCGTALGQGREIVVSRGELIEIGGSFRIPDVIEQGGATLREVGTTNRTRISDYERVIGEHTGLLAKIHRSNFYVEGFTEEVSVTELADLGRRTGVLTLYDAGSGVIRLPRNVKGRDELTLGDALRQGADVVTASGDKILGGPQAGIIVGRRDVVEVLRKHPMTRALRPCKLTLGILSHVLRLYRDGLEDEIPTFHLLSQNADTLRARARKLARRLKALPGGDGTTLMVRSESARVGGGSLPREELDTWVVAVHNAHVTAREMEEILRSAPIPVIARIVSDELVLDMRTVRDDELSMVTAGFEPMFERIPG